MKMKFMFVGLCSIALLSACTTMRESTSTVLAVDSSVKQYPTVADLDVHEKVETTITWSFVPFNWGQPPLHQRQKNLTADIIKSRGADVLLEPQIVYTKQSYGMRTLTITGYPATFKNFRKATKDDLEALKVVAPPNEKKIYNVSQPWYKKIFNKFF
ncbi:MAG: hypothetical protein IKB96_07810 [Prevotella sp.]|nr:hypothetical protein [Prevotella sp.]MBR2882212.1 hypothetical protein [Prevotella sp.]